VLYEVERSHDRKKAQIPVLSKGGIANASAQDDFCGTSDSNSNSNANADGCTISRIFDQSPNGNHLSLNEKDTGVSATGYKTTVGGPQGRHSVYGMYFDQGMGYRNDKTTGVPKGEEPESMYMVVAGNHFDDHW
jgi:hypothetical protein